MLTSTAASVPRLDRNELAGRYAEPRLAAAVGFEPFVDSGSAFSQIARLVEGHWRVAGNRWGSLRSRPIDDSPRLPPYLGVCSTNPLPAPAPFDDVPAGSFYADAVAWLYEQGITTGTSPQGSRPMPW